MSCKYCNGNNPLYQCGEQTLKIVNGWTNRHGEEYPGWQLKHDDRWIDCCFSVPIKYCPYCGEKLDGDAE